MRTFLLFLASSFALLSIAPAYPQDPAATDEEEELQATQNESELVALIAGHLEAFCLTAEAETASFVAEPGQYASLLRAWNLIVIYQIRFEKTPALLPELTDPETVSDLEAIFEAGLANTFAHARLAAVLGRLDASEQLFRDRPPGKPICGNVIRRWDYAEKAGLASVFLLQRRYREAVLEARAAYRISAGSPGSRALVNTILAAAYEGQGNFDAAIEVRERALIPLYLSAEQDPKAVDLKLWLELEAAINAQQERIGQ